MRLRLPTQPRSVDPSLCCGMVNEKSPLHPLSPPPNRLSDTSYRVPTAGFLSKINPRWHPYLQLMRLDRPYAALYFLIPQFVGCLEVSILNRSPSSSLFRSLAIICLWTFFFRGATCAWNDTIDVRFDRQVDRTRHRPLARGAISVPAAIIFTICLTLGALSTLLWLPTPAKFHGTIWIIGAALYPLSKRVMWFPQLICGIVLAWGVVFGASVMDFDTLGVTLQRAQNPALFQNASQAGTTLSIHPSWPLMFLYLGNVTWTVYYETVYSFADVKDDKTAGVKNIALLLGKYSKAFLGLLATSSVVFLAIDGYLINASIAFFGINVIGFAVTLAWKLWKVDLREPASCLRWFMLGGMTAGALMVSGLASEYTISLLH